MKIELKHFLNCWCKDINNLHPIQRQEAFITFIKRLQTNYNTIKKQKGELKTYNVYVLLCDGETVIIFKHKKTGAVTIATRI